MSTKGHAFKGWRNYAGELKYCYHGTCIPCTTHSPTAKSDGEGK